MVADAVIAVLLHAIAERSHTHTSGGAQSEGSQGAMVVCPLGNAEKALAEARATQDEDKVCSAHTRTHTHIHTHTHTTHGAYMDTYRIAVFTHHSQTHTCETLFACAHVAGEHTGQMCLCVRMCVCVHRSLQRSVTLWLHLWPHSLDLHTWTGHQGQCTYRLSDRHTHTHTRARNYAMLRLSYSCPTLLRVRRQATRVQRSSCPSACLQGTG